MKRLIFLCSIAIIFLFATQNVSAQVLEGPAAQEPFVRETSANLEPVPYPSLREADVFWGKTIWRTIDLREKANHPLYYPTYPMNGRVNLITLLMDGLKENMIRAFDSDQLSAQKNFQEIMSTLSSSDSVTLYREYPPYDPFDTVLVKDFDPSDVLMFRLKEFWFFDKQRSVLECRIMAMCPVTVEYDDQGEFKGFKPLFWVSFPEVRFLFAKSEVFNRQSDVERRTFDDMFFKRMFSSYIYKESNVYDRYINEYAIALDALLEADRIKEEIFIKEHDLWEY